MWKHFCPELMLGLRVLGQLEVADELSSLSRHTDYTAAKAGDIAAALRVAQDIVTDDLVARVRARIGTRHAVILPVVSEEASGRNKIPSRL